MTIGIDIDNTITNTSIYSNTLLKKDPLYNNKNNYRELNEEQIKDFLTKYLESIVKNVLVKEDVIDTLNYWKNKGHKIVFITARGAESTSDFVSLKSTYLTSLYFAKNNIPFDKLIFFQEEKGNACLNEFVDIFIDDRENVLDEVAKKGIKTLRISEERVDSKHKLVQNWQEIKKYIDIIFFINSQALTCRNIISIYSYT